jgi:hypothetical protein
VSSVESARSWQFELALGAARAFAPALVLIVFGLLLAGVIPVSIWTWVVTGVLFAAAFLVLPKGVRLGEVAEVPRMVLGATLVVLSFSLFYYLLSRKFATDGSVGVLPLVLFLLAFALAGGVMLGVPRFRRMVLGEPGTIDVQLTGVLGPFALLAVMFVVMTSVFAAVTLVAADRNIVDLTAGAGLPSFEDIAQLYVWQFCKSVPLLDVNETLRWNVPFIYKGTGTGFLVLLYKVAVILPLIGTFLVYWKEQIE